MNFGRNMPQINLPDDLFAAFSKKAKEVFPNSGDASSLALGNLIRYFINSKGESALVLETPEGKLLTLTDINDSFFEQFVQNCKGMYPDSDKPEVDFLLDSMASLVNVDNKVILMSGIPTEYEESLRKTLDAAFGGGSQAVYQLLGKLLLKAKNNRVIAVQINEDASTPNFDDPKFTVIAEGILAEQQAPALLSVVGMMISKLIAIFGSIGVLAMRRVDRLVNSILETKDGALTLFAHILKSADAGKLYVTNIQNAPIYSKIGDNAKGQNTLVFCNVPDKSLDNLALYGKALGQSFKSQLGVDIPDYAGNIGLLIYLLDSASVDSKDSIDASYELSRLSKIFQDTVKEVKDNPVLKEEGLDFDDLKEFFNTDANSSGVV